MNFRKAWFEWVAKTRKKMKGGTHKEAMSAASITWPKQKAKLQRRAAREAKRQQKDTTNPENS